METQSLVKEICPTTTQAYVKKGALLVDVREEHEVAELSFDVPSILNIPLSEFDNRYLEIPNDQTVVMVGNGEGSLRAAGFLINHGYSHVLNMKHGIVRWVQKGFPIKGDPSVISSIKASGSNSSCC
jgi:rhodanese-related sulfurtransferase